MKYLRARSDKGRLKAAINLIKELNFYMGVIDNDKSEYANNLFKALYEFSTTIERTVVLEKETPKTLQFVRHYAYPKDAMQRLRLRGEALGV